MAPVQETWQNTGLKIENEDANDVLQAISMWEPLCAPLLLTCFGAQDAPGAPYCYVKVPNQCLVQIIVSIFVQIIVSKRLVVGCCNWTSANAA